MRRRGDGVGWGRESLPEVRSETKKLLPLLIIDDVRVVLDLQEGNRRRAVVQLRFIKIRMKPHVEAVAVLVIASSGFSALVFSAQEAGHGRDQFGSDNNHSTFVLC